MLEAIHAQESRQAAEAKAVAVAAELGRMKLGKLAEWITTTVAETLAYLAFPSSTGGASARIIHSSASCARSGDGRESSVHFRTGRAPSTRGRQVAACRRFAVVDAALFEHGLVEGGPSCRGMKRLARVHQEDGRHPHLCHRRSPDLRASDGGSRGVAWEIHTSINECN